jgi:catechol 2,3-dioxygenase-like lactoylglutathione lyase family enzyme
MMSLPSLLRLPRPFLIAAVLVAAASPARAQLSPMNAAGITYGHVHLNVSDVEVQKKLWVDTFGGVFVQKGPLMAVKFPNMLIALAAKAPTGPSQGTVMDHFGFKVRSMPEMLAALKGLGYTVQSEFTGAEGFPNAYVLGPDGLRIEMQEDKTLSARAIPNHIHFLTPEFEKLLDWYAQTFSLTKRSRGTIKTTADAGTVNLSFQTAQTPVIGTKGRAIDHIGFEVKDLAAFCKQLEAKGIKFDVPFREVPAISLKIAYITDATGVYIELTEGYDKY